MSLNVSYSFSPTTTISSSQVNQNFTDIVNYINNTACVTGMIMSWSGSVATIPTGWALDTNSRDKFIIGAGNLYNPGASGGATTHNHTYSGTTGTPSGDSKKKGDNADGYCAESTHTHAYSGTTANGSSLPPYYAYCFIKKS